MVPRLGSAEDPRSPGMVVWWLIFDEHPSHETGKGMVTGRIPDRSDKILLAAEVLELAATALEDYAYEVTLGTRPLF